MEPDDDSGTPPTDEIFFLEDLWEETGMAQRGQPAAFQTGGAPAAASRFLVDWVDGHRETATPPDPTYPDGCAIDVALDAPRACRLQLAWPAQRCGQWVITCRDCGFAIALATAGRPDDPRTVRMPCRTG